MATTLEIEKKSTYEEYKNYVIGCDTFDNDKIEKHVNIPDEMFEKALNVVDNICAILESDGLYKDSSLSYIALLNDSLSHGLIYPNIKMWGLLEKIVATGKYDKYINEKDLAKLFTKPMINYIQGSIETTICTEKGAIEMHTCRDFYNTHRYNSKKRDHPSYIIGEKLSRRKHHCPKYICEGSLDRWTNNVFLVAILWGVGNKGELDDQINTLYKIINPHESNYISLPQNGKYYVMYWFKTKYISHLSTWTDIRFEAWDASSYATEEIIEDEFILEERKKQSPIRYLTDIKTMIDDDFDDNVKIDVIRNLLNLFENEKPIETYGEVGGYNF